MTLHVVSPTAALLDGRYLLEEPVGKGGMATVYRAEDTHLGRTVAIKMIHDHDDVLRSADRAHTEKALLASLNHPALVTLFDAQLEPHRSQYLVMEFVDGPTLADLMTGGPMAPRRLARITQELAEGLAAVHAAGIVHRDVKPSNVLLARTGDPGIPWAAKLADFGIACAIDRARTTGRGVVFGTLAYMAPEQLRDADPGTAVDIFSLGLVVLAALTGRTGYPELGSGRAAALARVMQPPTIPDAVDGAWRELLERMTRLDPAERPDAHEVARAAEALARSSAAAPLAWSAPISETGSGRTPPTGPTAALPVASRVHRRRKVALGATGALLAALAGAATVLVPPPDEPGRIATTMIVRTTDASRPADPAQDAGDDESGAPTEVVNEQEDGDGDRDGTADEGPGDREGRRPGEGEGDKGNGDRGKDKAEDVAGSRGEGSDRGKGGGTADGE